jgi:Cu+-exporting ATPase
MKTPPIHTTSLDIEGMTCASCVMRVERALGKVPGVASVTVNLATEKASVTADAGVDATVLVAAVKKAGYTTHSRRPTSRATAPGANSPQSSCRHC